MDRKIIYAKLNDIATVRQLSNREGVVKENTLILSKKSGMGSTENSLGSFQYWEVMCYVPATSMLALDNLVTQVEETLKELDVELTYNNTPEFYDEVLQAYMISVEFRTIKRN